MTAALLLAAPAIVIMLIIDLSFGLVNRYAPSLNVFALTLPIKARLSTAVILLMIGALMDFVLQRLGDSSGFLEVLQKADRKSDVEGKSVSARVDLGGRRIINKKTNVCHLVEDEQYRRWNNDQAQKTHKNQYTESKYANVK